jgi:hypothetical protein
VSFFSLILNVSIVSALGISRNIEGTELKEVFKTDIDVVVLDGLEHKYIHCLTNILPCNLVV